MSDNWDEHANNWDREEPVRFYSDQAFQSLVKHVDVRDNEWKGKRILDFGCGTGLLAEKLAPLAREVIAVDTSPNMIDVLRKKELSNVTAVCTDISEHAVHSSIPWFSDFDLIVASSVCGFLPNYELTVGVLSQTLCSQGYFVQWDWLSSNREEFGLTTDRVAKALSSAGLKRVQVGEAFTIAFDGEQMPVLMAVASAA